MRVAIADDSVLLREGLVSLLAASGFEITAQVGTAVELLAAIAEDEPDVAIIDVRMPPTHSDEGIRAAEELEERHPGVGALVLSQYIEPGYVLRLLERRTSGRGYLLKDNVGEVTTFLDAVRRVGEGGSFVDPLVVDQLLSRERADAPLRGLTPRELDILRLMAEGRSNRAICEELFVSPKTVETHIRNVFIKLGLGPTVDDDRRVMAVLRYLRAD